ncbi:MAG: protein kinase [Candidatus Omnitrophota bacterium]
MNDKSVYWRSDDGVLKLFKGYIFADRFRLLEHLGRGGFGQVWRVRDLLLKQEVALKISVGDLTKETLILRRLSKDQYVSIFDYVKDKNLVASAYSMEILEKPWITLDAYQQEYLSKQFDNPAKRISAIKMVIYIGIDLLLSLTELHGKKFAKKNRWCHADIKPQNIYIHIKRAKLVREIQWEEAIIPFLKIGDLGLAHPAGSVLDAGTPAYMAPEQNGLKCVSVATDIFSVGQTLAAMIAGYPFGDELKSFVRMKKMLAPQIQSAYILEKITKLLRRMTVATPTLRVNGKDSIRLLRSVMASEEDWKILDVFMLPEFDQGISLADAADILFDEFALSRGWRNRTNERIAELKSIVKSMYNRGILSLIGHKYSVRT